MKKNIKLLTVLISAFLFTKGTLAQVSFAESTSLTSTLTYPKLGQSFTPNDGTSFGTPAKSSLQESVLGAPTITSFTPTEGVSGTTVTITGTNFTGTTAVSFGGTSASSFNVVSATSITAVVASGTSGDVSVTNPLGTATKSGFTFGVIPDSNKTSNVFSGPFTWTNGGSSNPSLATSTFDFSPRIFTGNEFTDPNATYIVDVSVNSLSIFPGSRGASFGIVENPLADSNHDLGILDREWGYLNNGNSISNNNAASLGLSWDVGDVVRFKYNAQTGDLSYYLQNTTTGAFDLQGTDPAFSNVAVNQPGRTLSIGLSVTCFGDCQFELLDFPEIQITSADASVDFGNTDISGAASNKTFTIGNTTTATLNLSGTPIVAIGGTDASDFTVTTQPAATINGNSSSDFIIAFNPATTGTKTATVTIMNNDPDEGTYTFNIQGTAVTPNTAPTATNVTFTGSLEVGQTLTGSYTYTDADSNTESGSTYKWYRSDDASGTNKTAISGATATTYTLTTADMGKYISFEVTPNDGTAFGNVVESALQGAVTKKTPTITFTDITKTYGDADFNLGATSNATGTISYSIVAGGTGTATLSGTNNQTVTLGNAGTVTLRATQASDANYKAATKDITLTINTKPITVTADAKTKVYGDADPTLTYQITTGALVGTDALTGSLTRATGEDVGTYAISSTLANSNYNITYVSADLTITQKAITVTADAKTKVYGDADPTLTYQITTGTLVGSDTLSGGLTRATGEDVGTYAISSTLANSNYNITYVSADLTITQKAITVTADAKTKVYGDADPTLTYQITTGALLGTDALTGTLSRATGEDVGTYAISSTLSNTNYNITFVSADLTITQKPITITADAKSKVYGEADPTLTYQITTGSLVGTDALTGTLTRATGEDVGTYAISSTLANSNYNITFVSADFTITQKPITITADAKSKVYGDADPTLTYQITTGALLGTDTLTGTLARASGESVGTYAISSTLANSNYNITYVSADLTITAKALTITADAKTKVYGDVDPTLTYQITTGALLGTDTLTGTLARVTGENAGTYAISSTLANTNYSITYVSADLTITAKALTITADAKTKVYGDADPTLTYQITTGALLGTDTLTGTLARASGESVGTYAISSTLANSNYNITYVSADLTITAKALTITADAKSKVYGEADPTLTYQITTGALLGTDALTGTLSRATGEDVGTYAISSTLSNTNYNITFVSADLTITQKPITVTADAKSKVYGDADPTLTYQITSGSLVGTDALTGTLSRVAGESVGTYAITQNTLAANANYSVTYVSADLTITAAAVTATTEAASGITTTGAVLNGTLNDGGATTTAAFEYGTAPDLTGAQAVTATPNSITAESGTTAVTATLTGLLDKTTYYYRVVGTNTQGTSNGLIMSFSTLDGTPPSIVGTVPADDATGVTSSNLAIVFDEDVQKGTGDILIKRTSDDQTVATIPVNGSEVTIDNSTPKLSTTAGTVTIHISPTLTLPSNTALYVEIPAGAFTDTAGNAFAGITTNTLWNFSTDTVLGTADHIIQGFTLYPNPVKETLNIVAQENLKTVQVYNLMGQQVLQKGINSRRATVNLTHLPQGTYFVKITTDKTTKTVKVIKR